MTAFDSAVQLIEKLQKRELSALELLDLYLDRIARIDPDTNAICWMDAERAREQAAAITAAPDERRPLLGIPMTVKEAYDLAGSPTTWGMTEFADNVAATDSVAVERLKAAGAIVFGKSNVSVMLGDIQSYNDIYGTSNNPWNLAHTPGGSSGGSGAALAAGLCALEMGSDIGGSIRTPAHYCGVFGHKPTWSLIPSRGHGLPFMVSEPDIAVVGPMARSAFDLELQLDLLSHPDLLQSGVRYELPALAGRSLGDLRVAVWANDDAAPVTQEVAGRVERVAQAFRDAGATVHEDARPEFTSAHSHDVYYRLLLGFIAGGEGSDEAHEAHRQEAARLAPEDRSDAARDLRAMTMDHRTWIHLNAERDRLRWAWQKFFEDYDVVLAPQTATPAMAHDHRPFDDRTIEVDGETQPYWRQIFWAGLPGISHLPSTVIPTGAGEAGLPIGVQLIGPAYGDLVTIQIAQRLEREGFAFEPPPAYAE